MFRELTRKNKQLPTDACIRLLTQELRGVLSVLGDEEYPYGMPMNHLYWEEDGCIYFHCGKQTSHRMDAIRRHDKVSYCVYDQGYCREGEWALNISSVIVFGRMEVIDDPEQVSRLTEALCRKFTQDAEYIRKEIRLYGHETLLLKLTPEHICGKLVNES